MSKDLMTTETHVTDRKGTLKTAPFPYTDGDEIDSFAAGQMRYDDTTNILFIYDGTSWSGRLTVAM